MAYHLTERLSPDYARPDDPKAQAMPRGTGIFDLREPDGEVIATYRNLKLARRRQAILNTHLVLDLGRL